MLLLATELFLPLNPKAIQLSFEMIDRSITRIVHLLLSKLLQFRNHTYAHSKKPLERHYSTGARAVQLSMTLASPSDTTQTKSK